MIDLIIQPNLTKEQEQFLKNRFFDTCQQLGITTEKTAICYQQLYELYNQSSRHYHNLAHIYNFLKLVDYYQHSIQEPFLFELAIWYHDAIYEAKAKDNEFQSAVLFQKTFKKELSKQQLDYVDNLINSTAGHFPKIEHVDINYFLDLDLAILGANPAIYKLYKEAIWQEYKIVYPRLLYNMGRKKVLKSFLSRDKIYFSTLFFDNFEQTARQNMQLELDN